jgi:hypothetical protein
VAAWRRLGSGSPGARASGDSHAEGWAQVVCAGWGRCGGGSEGEACSGRRRPVLNFAILGLPAQCGGQESGRVGGYWKVSELFHCYVGP